MIGSRQGSALKAQGSGTCVGAAGVALLALGLSSAAVKGAEPVLTVRATVVGVASGGLTIDVDRWSTEAERAPVLAAFAAPVQPPSPAGTAAGRAGVAGRGGRASGRGGPPPSPAARLSTAVKAAPTVGYVWGAGVTGYSIKYAWHAGDRVVLITDRRLGAHAPEWDLPAGPSPEAEYTVIEIRPTAKGAREGKTSLHTSVSLDTAANTLALDGYGAAPTALRMTP